VKGIGAALVVLVVCGGGGVAYAWGGGGGGGNHCNASASTGSDGKNCPSLDIVWQNPSGVTPGPNVQCTLALNTSALTVLIGGLAPGTNCTFFASLANVGKDDVSLTENVTLSAPASCRLFTYGDNIPANPARELRSGSSYGFQGKVGLSSSAGNRCQGAVATFLVTITGSQSSSPCGNGPGGPQVAAGSRSPAVA